MLDVLSAREHEHKQEAQAALEEFDRKQWRQWTKSLPARAARFRLGSSLFKHLALERWTDARALHTRALRNRSQVALHELRIGIKRFRYIVENFLPEQHKAWSDDLKHVQDLLGEVHDLDVLWATALACRVFPDEASRRRWHALIREERDRRVEGYRQEMIGPDNLWQVWRAALPQVKQLKAIAERRTKLWAKALDPDFAHSERVARLAVELYDGLKAAGLLGSADESDRCSSLQIAALLHDVGKAKKGRGHHKASFKLIQGHGTPLGWKAEDMKRAAIVARFHCGALPTKNHKTLRDLLPNEQKIAIQLAAILRLANAFDAAHDGHIRRVRIEILSRRSVTGSSSDGKRYAHGLPRKPATLAPNEALVIAADGYAPNSPAAQTIAAERHLLETVLRRPIIVKAMKTWNVR
jgi:HD superfamily phosphodiesterase